MKVSISSLYNAVDEIIVLFDTPNNKKIKSKFFNKKKFLYIFLRERKKTNAPVQELLKLGRKHKGTHFLFLDADEALTYNLSKNLKVFDKNEKGDKYFFIGCLCEKI